MRLKWDSSDSNKQAKNSYVFLRFLLGFALFPAMPYSFAMVREKWMVYYEPQETVIIVTQCWHLRVAARRYFNKAIVELKERLIPKDKCIWKASRDKYNGYQADLIDFTIEPVLDFVPGVVYPDW